jgi:hypothetical protein
MTLAPSKRITVQLVERAAGLLLAFLEEIAMRATPFPARAIPDTLR